MNRVLLEQAFTPDQIKDRTTPHGTLSYIEGAAVIQRLNDAFQGEWSFDILTEDIGPREVRVRGKLTAAGESKTQYGKSDITLDGNEIPVSLADDLKAAATDSLKKSATLYGVGLHLYFDGVRAPIETTTAAPQPPVQGDRRESSPYPLPKPNGSAERVYTNAVHDSGSPDDDRNRVSSKQLGAIMAIGKAAGWSKKDLEDHAKGQYGRTIGYLTRRDASSYIDYLKAGAR